MENDSKKKMSARTIILIAAGLLLVAVIVQYVYMNGTAFGANRSREMRMTETGHGVTYDFGINTSFYNYNNARFFFFCTKDSMRYISSGGDLKWQEMLNLTNPQTAENGGVIAVGEAKGRHIYVFNTDGLMYDVMLDYPVLYFSVNPSGYLSVIAQLDSGYAIYVYNQRKYAEPLYSNLIHGTRNYPSAVAVSEDGKYIAIAMLDLNVRVASLVSFYYINNQDAGASVDGLFAGFEYPDQFVSCVRFMSDQRALVFTDSQIVCYRPGESNAIEELWTLELHNELERLAFYSDSRFAFVTGDKQLNDEEADEPGMVHIYNANGEQTGEYRVGRKVSYLSMGRDALIVGADRGFYAIDYRGNRLWEYVAMQDVRQMIFLENTDTVLMAGGTSAVVMKRTAPSVSEAPAEPIESPDPLESAGQEGND